MLRQLSSSPENGHNMFIYSSGMKHATPVGIVSRRRSEHGYIFLMYETLPDICHGLMTMVRARLFISEV